MTRSSDDVERRLDALARRRWSTPEAGFSKLTVGSGDGEITVYARPDAAAALLDTLTAAADALHDARAEATALRARVEKLEARAPVRAAPAPTRQHQEDARQPSARMALADVPAALVAPFHPSARTLASAKKDPLVALAVQASKAMLSDASELERARLLAMAYAASTADLERFWSARAQRSAAKLKAR